MRRGREEKKCEERRENRKGEEKWRREVDGRSEKRKGRRKKREGRWEK